MRADSLSERIERAWQLLTNGDGDGACALHAQLQAQAPDVPSVIGLGAALLAASGDPEGAIAELLRAAERVQETQSARASSPERTSEPPLADPPESPQESGVRYLLDAAELQLYALDDPDAAIESCQRALDLAMEDDELIDGVLIEAESYLALGDHDDEARALLAELDGCSIDDPAVLCRAGDHYAIMGDIEDAGRCFEAAIAIDADFADGHHGLGLVREAQGRTADQVRAWLRVRELDLAAERPPWQLSESALDEVVDSALAELPDEVRSRLGNVPIFVEDAPDEELVRSGIDPRLLGLFSGQPLPHQSHIVDGQQPTLERIQLFARNLERASASPEHFRAELRITVLHETAHFFGLEDDELDALGLG